MPPVVRSLTPARRLARDVLVAGYVGLVALGLLSEIQPRVFWTILLPLLPIGIVLMGFHTWRAICPLAFFGELGRRVSRGHQRRVPPWLERWFFPVTFGILLGSLALRLVATNGDGRFLSGLLVLLAAAAFLTNSVFTGKTWCNFVCPVGFVERVYTEPRSLRATPNSQCATCTACKRHCPDIDEENAYWKDLMSRGRQVAIYAFPGLVLAFYGYYWLRAGDWEAYFDGRWTRHPVDAVLVTGPGFFFAPAVPAVAAALLTLIALSLASYLVFRVVEGGLGRFVAGPERARHLGLALAAFAAFNLFYVFAGAPSLRFVPGATQLVAFAAPLVGTLFLVRRWQRTPEHFVGERGAVRLLRAWPFDEPPPKDASEVYGWIQASRQAREKSVAAYEATVRGMVADGLVRRGELRLLHGMRRQLGISEREHEQILAQLTEEERQLFDESGGVEAHAQLEGYQVALAEAIQRQASEEEVDELRRSFGVDPVDHEAVLARIRGASGELLSRARRHLERARRLQADLGVLGATEPTAARLFLCSLLGRARDERISRLLELVELAGDGPVIQSLRRRLFSGDPARRGPALEVLALACPGAEDLVRELGPLLGGRLAAPTDGGTLTGMLGRLLEQSDPYLRAAAAWAATELPENPLGTELARARDDDHPLVRETAARFSPARPVGEQAAATLSSIEVMHLLHAEPFFAELEAGDLHDLSQFAVEETVSPPAAICEAGDVDSDALFVVVSGEAEVVGGPGDGAGADHVIATLGRGELIGELSVLDGSPRSATVRPRGGPVRVLRIPGATLRGALLHRPRVAQSLLGLLATRIRRMVVPTPTPR